jgi:hypothetical protein
MSPDLFGQAACLGGLVWCERRCFELLGSWVPELPDPVVKAAADRHAQHHAWRAGQLWDRLPVLAQIDREDLVNAPAGRAGALAGALAGLQTPVGRLAGTYRVAHPRLAAAYRRWLAAASPLGDAAAVRTVRQVLADLDADRAEGEDLLQAAITSPSDAHNAGFSVARLETVLLGA